MSPEDLVVTLPPCPHCGYKTQKDIEWAKEHATFVCPNCQHWVRYKACGFPVMVKKVKKHLANLKLLKRRLGIFFKR